MTTQGTVKAWVDAKGFGFITTAEGEDVFVHRVNLVGVDALNIGDFVSFDLTYDEKKNKKTAMNVVGGTGASPAMMMRNNPGKGGGPPMGGPPMGGPPQSAAYASPYAGYGATPSPSFAPAPPIPGYDRPPPGGGPSMAMSAASALPPGLVPGSMGAPSPYAAYDPYDPNAGPVMQAPSAFAPQTGQPLQDTGADLAPGQCRGTVKAWNDMKGFGFIETPGMEDIFVHRCDLVGVEALIVGDHVIYRRDYDERKRKEAAKEVVGGTGRVAGTSGPGGRPAGAGINPAAAVAAGGAYGGPAFGMDSMGYGAYGKGNGQMRTMPY